MIGVGSKSYIDQTVETDPQDELAEVDLSMGKIVEKETLGEETSEKEGRSRGNFRNNNRFDRNRSRSRALFRKH